MVESNTIYAPKTGLYIPGTADNFVSTPDSADFDTGTECAIIWYGALDNWITGTAQGLVSRLNTTGDGSPALIVSETGTLRFDFRNSGSYVLHQSTVPNNFINGQYYWIKVVYYQSAIYFYYTQDGFNWIQLGDVVAAASSMNPGATSLLVGKIYSGQALHYSKGTHVKAAMYSDADMNNLVAEADFSYPWTNDKYRDKTGKIWTINGSAWAWEYQDDPSERYLEDDIIYGGDAHSLIPDTVGGATASSLPTHIYEGDVI